MCNPQLVRREYCCKYLMVNGLHFGTFKMLMLNKHKPIHNTILMISFFYFGCNDQHMRGCSGRLAVLLWTAVRLSKNKAVFFVVVPDQFSGICVPSKIQDHSAVQWDRVLQCSISIGQNNPTTLWYRMKQHHTKSAILLPTYTGYNIYRNPLYKAFYSIKRTKHYNKPKGQTCSLPLKNGNPVCQIDISKHAALRSVLQCFSQLLTRLAHTHWSHQHVVPH